jgi:flagellin-like hook-associated protein FlgL
MPADVKPGFSCVEQRGSIRNEDNDDEQVELKSVLSDEIDVDMAQAASDFIARQAAYEASLRSIASLHQLSLLDFI